MWRLRTLCFMGSFTYDVIKFLAFLPTPPLVFNRHLLKPPLNFGGKISMITSSQAVSPNFMSKHFKLKVFNVLCMFIFIKDPAFCGDANYIIIIHAMEKAIHS